MSKSWDFYSVDNFKLAYNRLKTAGYDYYVQLYLRDWQNFGLDLEDNIKTLLHDIQEGLYKPTNPLKLYIPKPNKLIRPITVLTFIDLLVYQSIANVIAECAYERLSIFYHKEVFGNIYNYNERKPDNFFFVKWDKQWKDFEHATINYFNEGNKYILDFDLASFYDTVDHHLLATLLRDEYKVPNQIVGLLTNQLTVLTKDLGRNNYHCKHGIPQGPQASSLLSEIYISYIDDKMRKLKQKHLDFEYLRYADDIRVFTKSNRQALKYFAYLDLLARDMGLIPQSSKTTIREVDDVKKITKINEYFSKINSQKKAKEKISTGVNSYLIQKIKDELDQESPDKTTIKFAIYKIEADHSVKESLIRNTYKIPHLFEEVCFYLSKFPDDSEVLNWLKGQLDTDPLYSWTLAITLKYFSGAEYLIPLWNKYSVERKNWYIQYFLLENLAKSHSEFFSQISPINTNFCPLVKKKIFKHKYNLANNIDVKRDIIRQMCIDPDILIALEAKQLIFESSLKRTDGLDLCEIEDIILPIHDPKLNRFLKSSIASISSSYIVEELKLKGIVGSELIFDELRWDTNIYERLKCEFKSALNLFETSPWGIWMVYMDNFNELVLEKLLQDAGIEFKEQSNTYGGLLDYKNFLKTNFPKAYKTFKSIHYTRCTRVAHPRDKDFKITKYLKWKESSAYQEDQFSALKEIVHNYPIVFKDKFMSEPPGVSSTELGDISPVKTGELID